MSDTNGHLTLELPGGRPRLLDRARLVPVTHEAQVKALQSAAAADNHPVIAPTHVMLRGEQTIGYLSIGGLPCVHAWFDTRSGHAADSLKMIETGEAIYHSNGGKAYVIACADESPFTPHMERMGFQRLGQTVLWLKTLV